MYLTNRQKTQRQRTRSGNSIWWLLPEEIGAPTFEMRYFEIPPGGHTSAGAHPYEHEVFVVAGSGVVREKAPDGRTIERELSPGDALFVAPNEWHQFANPTGEPFGFICVVPRGCE